MLNTLDQQSLNSGMNWVKQALPPFQEKQWRHFRIVVVQGIRISKFIHGQIGACATNALYTHRIVKTLASIASKAVPNMRDILQRTGFAGFRRKMAKGLTMKCFPQKVLEGNNLPRMLALPHRMKPGMRFPVMSGVDVQGPRDGCLKLNPPLKRRFSRNVNHKQGEDCVFLVPMEMILRTSQ